MYEPDEETIDIDNVALDGGVLAKTLYLSVDPYMRNRMRDPSIKSYAPPFELGSVPDGRGIAVVLRSENPKIKTGDHISASLSWKAYNILDDKAGAQVIQNSANLPLSTFLGITGGPGLTAFYGLHAFAKMKKGETMFVSTASGAVGGVVVQLAKLAGLKVIGSAGSDEKVKYLKDDLGIDVAFNYKTTDTREQLKEHGPIDVYWDNVGGEVLDAALEFSAPFGRFILCGYASEYNKGSKESYGIKHMSNGLVRSLSLNGFIVTTLIPQFGLEPFQKEYVPLVAGGKIKYLEHKTQGLEKIGEALVGVLKGDNLGKAVVVVAEQ